MNNRSRIFLLIALFYSVIGSAILVAGDGFIGTIPGGDRNRAAFHLLAAVFALAGPTYIIFLYVSGRLSASAQNDPDNESRNMELQHVRRQIENLHSDMVKLSTPLDPAQVQEMREQVTTHLRSEMSSAIIEEIERRYSPQGVVANTASGIRQIQRDATRRLERELGDVVRRGNVNLALGFGTTCLAGYVLWKFVGDLPQDIGAAHLAMRLSIVVFIEVFSFFFLRLYKAGLSEIKYYQNELTTLSSKFMALEAALLPGVEKSLEKTLGMLVKTERNFVLKKGESTVDIELRRAEDKSFENALALVARVLPWTNAPQGKNTAK